MGEADCPPRVFRRCSVVMIHSYAWRESCVCVTRLIRMCDMIHYLHALEQNPPEFHPTLRPLIASWDVNPCTSHVEGFGLLRWSRSYWIQKVNSRNIPGTKITSNLTRHHFHISVTDVAKHAGNCGKGLNAKSPRMILVTRTKFFISWWSKRPDICGRSKCWKTRSFWVNFGQILLWNFGDMAHLYVWRD